MNRRGFLQSVVGTTFGFHVVPRHVLGRGFTPPSEKLNIAGIGIGGQGGGVIRDMATENIVALCDVDSKKAAGTFKAFPKAEQFRDYRVLLEQRKDIDAVMIATSDHMHAPITIAALRAGKHVYVEKPMAHSIEEARVMTRVARETGLVTQMGNNGHAGEGLRLDALSGRGQGDRRGEIHCWSDRPGKWWVQNQDRPAEPEPVPAALDWDLWVGAAPTRPYSKLYHPRTWRGWFDFAAAGRHGHSSNMDPAFYALELGTPVAVEATTSESRSRNCTRSGPCCARARRHVAIGRPVTPSPGTTAERRRAGARPPGRHKALRQRDRLRRRQRGSPIQAAGRGRRRFTRRAAGRNSRHRQRRSRARIELHHQEWIKACKDHKLEDAKAGFAYSGTFAEALLVGPGGAASRSGSNGTRPT